MEPRSKKRARTTVECDDGDDVPTSNTDAATTTLTLTTLPVPESSEFDIIYHIASFLDNKSWARLAIAWRLFLHVFARSLDPWNSVRKRLMDSDNVRSSLAAMQVDWFSPCPKIQSDDDESFEEFERRIIKTPSLVHALLDYSLLDAPRVRFGHVQPMEWGLSCPELLQALYSVYGERRDSARIVAEAFPIEFGFYDPVIPAVPECEVCGKEHGPLLKRVTEALGCAAFPLTNLELCYIDEKETPKDWNDYGKLSRGIAR